MTWEKRLIGRRNLLQLGIAAGLTSCIISGANFNLSKPAIAKSTPTKKNNPIDADEALQRLIDGNQRFIQSQRKHPRQSLTRVQAIAKEQYPFAAILGCADSRIPPEIIFDLGLGDLFTVRVAGNLATDAAIGSLEYSTVFLDCRLVVVLGHENCGVVKTAINQKRDNSQDQNQPVPGHINYLVESIQPVIDKINFKTTNLIDEAVIANIKYQVNKLKKCSPILAQFVREGKLKIIGARYDLDTGKINIVA